MKQQTFKKLSKLSVLALSLAGLAGIAGEAVAETKFMMEGGFPSCAVCHQTNKTGGLIAGKHVASFGAGAGKTIVGPYWFWTNPDGQSDNAISKAARYCQKKLHDPGANWALSPPYKCQPGNAQADQALVAPLPNSAPGLVVETDDLGSKASLSAATDIWSVTCPADTAQLTVAVRDNLPINPALISIQLKKGDAASTVVIDPSEASPYSDEVSLPAGPGVYDVLVNKSASKKKGLENYSAKIACKSMANEVIGIDAIEKTQDQ